MTDPAIDYATRLSWETEQGIPDPEYLNLKGLWKDTLFVKHGYRVYVRSQVRAIHRRFRPALPYPRSRRLRHDGECAGVANGSATPLCRAIFGNLERIIFANSTNCH